MQSWRFNLGADGVVDLLVVEERLAAVTPWEGLLADVVVFVERALGRLVAVLVELVNHVVVVVLLDVVDVHAQNDRAGNADVQRHLAPQIGGLCCETKRASCRNKRNGQYGPILV